VAVLALDLALVLPLVDLLFLGIKKWFLFFIKGIVEAKK
jgi:hypothetical protein